MPSERDAGPGDPLMDALVASARRLGREAEAEPPQLQAERETRIWTSVTRVTAAGPGAGPAGARSGWLWAALIAVACAAAGAAATWLVLR